MNTKITELTRGEEEIMQILWRLGDAVVNDIIARTDEPHPKYTTVATFLWRTRASSAIRPRARATAIFR